MTWLKLDDAMGEHRKITRTLKESRPAIALHFLGLLHCAKYLTDGFVEDEFVDDLCGLARIKPAERRQAIDALVKHNLWEPVDGGWMAHDYLDHNPSRAEVLARRESDAARKRAGRQAQSSARPTGVRADGGGTSTNVQAESDGPVPPRPDPHPSPSLEGVGPIDAARDLPADTRPDWSVIEGGGAA